MSVESFTRVLNLSYISFGPISSCVQFTSQQKEIDDHKEEIKRYQTETMKLNNVIRNLEKDIQGLKKEILERDETIQDKVSWNMIHINSVLNGLW